MVNLGGALDIEGVRMIIGFGQSRRKTGCNFPEVGKTTARGTDLKGEMSSLALLTLRLDRHLVETSGC